MERKYFRIHYVRKSEDDWLSENPVLRRASPRVTRPSKNFPYAQFKIGDGRTPWIDTPHFKPHVDATLVTPSPIFPFNKETVSLDVLYFEITPFTSFYNIPQKSIDLQAATDPLFINKIYDERHFGTQSQIQAPKDVFEDNTTYYWRMRYVDQENYISGWSSVYSFTVQKISPLIRRPRILKPITGELFTTEPIVELSEFDSLLSTDVHIATHYQISKDIRFRDLVYDVVTLDDLTRTSIPEDILDYDTTYYIRVRQSSGGDRWSSWSKRVRIRSHQLTIIPPRILVPSESNLLLDDILVQLSQFKTDPPNRDIHVFTHYKITDDDLDTPPVYERVSDTELRNTIIPVDELQPFTHYTLQVRYKGSRTDWSEWVTFSFQVKTPQIKTPKIIRPSGEGAVSLEAILETSPFTVLNTNDTFEHVGTRFQIARDRNFERMVHDTGVGSNLIRHTVPDGLLDPSTVYFIRVRHKGEGLGWSLWSDTVQAITVDPMIAQPRVLSPDADDDDVLLEPTLETSPFRVLFDTDTHVATQYQLFAMENPELFLYDIIAHVDLVEHDLPFDVLNAETTYGIRVRHKGERFSWSAWSQPLKFTTRLPDIITPSVLRPIDDDVLDAPVVIQTSEFETQTSDDEHIETHYQIATDMDFNTVVYQTQDKDDLLIHTVPEETLFQEDMYYVRVRHRGNVFGWSEWSDQVSFSILDTAPLVEETDEINGRILARVARPDITEPTAETGLTNQTFRIMTSPFDVVNGTDEQVASQYQIRRLSDNVIVYDSGPVNDFEERRIRGDQLSFDIPYRVRARHKGRDLNWSSWSPSNRFTLVPSAETFIQRPAIEDPTASETVSRKSLTIDTSPFAVVNTDDTHIASQYRIARVDANEGDFVYDSNETTEDLTSQRISESQLSPDVVYRAWVRHKGESLGWSDWSLPRIFDTLVKEGPYLERPEVLLPNDGEDIPSDSVTIQISPFDINDGTDTQIATQYRIFDAATNEIVYDSGSVTDFISRDVPETQLPFGRDYLVQARHQGEVVGWSKWSPTVRFTSTFAQDPFIEKPHITSPGDNDTVPEDNIVIHVSPFSVIGQDDVQTATQYIVYQGTDENVIYDSGATEDFTSRALSFVSIDFATPVTVKVRHRGKDLGWSAWSDPISITVEEVHEPFVITPTIDDPLDGTEVPENNIEITTEPFNVMNGDDEHIASQYRVQDTSGNTVHTSGSSDDLITHTVPEGELTSGNQYILNVRHLGEALGWSDWSDPVSFTVNEAIDPFIVTPTIDSPSSGDQVPENAIEITTSDFRVDHGTDDHDATQYRVWDTNDNLVHDSGPTSDLITHKISRNTLVPENQYNMRVRHKSESLGWSDWSDAVVITVGETIDPFVARPSTAFPNNANTVFENNITISTTLFNVVGGEDTHVSTEYRITDTGGNVVHTSGSSDDLITHTVPEGELTSGNQYILNVRHLGETLGWSEWSDPVSFTVDDVQQPFIATPTINDPSASNSNTVPEDNIEITTTPFTVIEGDFAGSTDTHRASHYKVRDANSNVVHDSGSTSDLTSHVVPENELELNTSYTVIARHLGEDLGWSDWSDPEPLIVREVIDPFIATPTINSPSGGEDVPENVLEIEASDFIVVNDSDDHDGSRYQVQDIDGNIVHDSGTVGDLTTHVVPRNTLSPGNSYKLRVRYLGKTYGWSNWSDMLTITVTEIIDPFIKKPTVDLPDNPNTVNPDGVFENDIQITTSPFFVEENGTDTHAASQYQILDTDGNVVHNSGSTDDLTVHTVPENTLTVGIEYSAVARHLGETFDWSAWSNPVFFVVEDAPNSFIKRPSAVFPNNANMVPEDNIEISTTLFDIVGNATDTHVATEYRITDVGGNVVHTSGPSDDLITHTVSQNELTPRTDYILNVRHLGEDLGWSAWSPDNEFTVEAVPAGFVEKPVINTPSRNGPPVPEDSIEIMTDPFSVSSGTDEHTASRYRIQNVNDNTDSHDSGPTTDRLSHIVPEGVLTPDNDYMVTARHFGRRLKWSDWSDGVTFRVEAVPDNFVKKPSVMSPSPTDAVPEDSIEITTSAFDTEGDMVDHVVSQYRFEDNDGTNNHDSGPVTDLTTHVVSENTLTANNNYTLTVRHRGEGLGWSAWSDPVTFMVEEVPDPSIVKPSIISLSSNNNLASNNGIDLVPEDSIVIETSDFSVINGSDTHEQTEYEILVDNVNETEAHRATEVNVPRTVHNVAENELTPGTTYKVRARHGGQEIPWSEWSDFVRFTVEAVPDPFVVKPSITRPGDNTSVLENSIVIETSTFIVRHGSSMFDEAEYEIRNAGDNSLIHNESETTGTRTIHNVAEGILAPNTTYKVRARHHDRDLMWSEWSDYNRFTVDAAVQPSIERPIISVLDSNGVERTPTGQDIILDTSEFTLELSPFRVINGSGTSDSAQYQITPISNSGSSHDMTVNTDIDMYTPPSDVLEKNITYEVRGRYKGVSIDYSEWSVPVTITLALSVQKPQVIDPNDGDTNVPVRPTIKSSSFSTEDTSGSDPHVSTEYEIFDKSDPNHPNGILHHQSKEGSPDLIEHELPSTNALMENRDYKVRLRHKGQSSGYSPWSDFVSFTTIEPQGSELFTTNGTFTVPSGVTSVSVVVVPGKGTASFGTHITQEPDTWDSLPDLDWTTITGANPYRWGHDGGFDFDGNYWVVGGRNSNSKKTEVISEMTDTVVSFDPTNIGNGWTVRESLPDARRDHASVVDRNGYLWVINGFIDGHATDSILRLDTKNSNPSWESVNFKLNNNPTKFGFDFHQAVLDAIGLIWVIGGRDGGLGAYNTSVYRIIPNTTVPSVETITSLTLDSGRERQGMVVDKNGYLWMLGGNIDDTSVVPFRSVWRFNTEVAAPVWEEMVSARLPDTFVPRSPLLVTGPNDHLYVAASRSSTRRGLLRLDPDNPQDGWQEETPEPLDQRIRGSHGFIDQNMRFWAVGGTSTNGVGRANLSPGLNQMKGTSFDISGTQIELGGPHGSDGQILKWENDISVDPNGDPIPITVSDGDSAVRVIWGPGVSFPNNMS